MIKEIFLKTSYKIWLVYTFLVVEYFLYACAPWLLGKTIDTVLAGQYYYFILYGSCGVAGLIIGFVRRRLDTRIDTIFNNELALLTKINKNIADVR